MTSSHDDGLDDDDLVHRYVRRYVQCYGRRRHDWYDQYYRPTHYAPAIVAVHAYLNICQRPVLLQIVTAPLFRPYSNRWSAFCADANRS